MTTRTRRAGRKVWANLALISLILFIFASAYFYSQTSDLSSQNRHRIADIQASRIASCERTYEGIRAVFKPFLPAPNAKQTAKQRHDIRLFNSTIDRLKAKCARQVTTKGTP